MPADSARVIDRLAIPSCRYPGSQKRFHLRCEIKCAVVKGIKERLDTKPVARGEDRAVHAVPQHNRELSPQPVQAMSTEVLVKMQGNFTVRAGAQAMTGLLQFFLNRLVAV